MTRESLDNAVKKAMISAPTRPAETAEVLVQLRKTATDSGWLDLARVCLELEYNLVSGFLKDKDRAFRLLSEVVADAESPVRYRVLLGDHLRDAGRHVEANREYEAAIARAEAEGNAKVLAAAKQRLKRRAP